MLIYIHNNNNINKQYKHVNESVSFSFSVFHAVGFCSQHVCFTLLSLYRHVYIVFYVFCRSQDESLTHFDDMKQSECVDSAEIQLVFVYRRHPWADFVRFCLSHFVCFLYVVNFIAMMKFWCPARVTDRFNKTCHPSRFPRFLFTRVLTCRRMGLTNLRV